MAVKSSWAAGDVLSAVDLTDTFAAKAPSASPTFTGTVALPSTTTLNGVTLTPGALVPITTATANASSSVSINGCFTSTYDNYRIVAAFTSNTNDAAINIRYRASGVDNSNNNYNVRGDYGSTTSTAAAIMMTRSGGEQFLVADIASPKRTAYTSAHYTASRAETGVVFNHWAGAWIFDATTSFDGFTIYPASGTFTSATNGIRVYGYNNS